MIGELKKNLDQVQLKIDEEMAKNKNIFLPRIIAVSKKQSSEKIIQLNKLGIQHFAENYLQEALEKIKELKNCHIHWHFIGKLQSKKIKDIVGNFELIHTVSRISEAEKISEIAFAKKQTQNILIQINVASEDTKQGFLISEVEEKAQEINKLKNINLVGMMVFPPLSKNDEETLNWFSISQKLFQKLQKQIGSEFQHLSMGTSGDYHLALRQGSTDLRLGECLLGSRQGE